jgi:hypothetical protein
MHPILPFAMICVGVAVVIFRKPFARFNARSITTMFGEAGKRSAERSTPAFAALWGVGMMVFGLFLLTRILVGSS